MRNLLKKLTRATALLGALALAGCGGSAADAVKADWLTNPNQAIQTAGQERRLVLIAFVGSDWSVASQNAMKDVLDTKDFKDFADSKLVLLRVDITRGAPESEQLRQQYETLMNKAAIDRLPAFLLLDPFQQHVVWRGDGYAPNGPGGLIAQLDNINTQWQQFMAQTPNAAQGQAVPSAAGAPQLPGVPAGNGAPASALTTMYSAPSGLPGVPSAAELMRQIQQGSVPSTAPTPAQLPPQAPPLPSAPGAPAPAASSATDGGLPALKQLQ